MTVHSVYIMTASSTSVSDGQVPERFELFPDFPSPFNVQLQIRFALPKGILTNLSIFNVHGSCVEVLLDGYKDAGYHTISWDGSLQASGVYFIHLKTSRNQSVFKCMLVK